MKKIFIFWALCSLAGNSLGERTPVIQQVFFLSTNFENIFTWKVKEETPPDTLYDVQYQKYGDTWQSKPECQNITQHFCNLTHETEDFTERYHAQVRAIFPNCCNSDWVLSWRFYPLEDTDIGNPDVKYTPNVHSIKFAIQPPYTPLRDEDNLPLTVVDIFNQLDIVFHYEITIFCPKTQLKWAEVKNNEEFEITNLDPDTEYNGTIHIKYSDKISKPYVFRVQTLPDNTWLPYLFGVLIVITIFIFGTVCYFIYKYVKQHNIQQPTSLDFKGISHFQPFILNVDHALSPYDLSKVIQPEARSAEVSHHIRHMLGEQKLLNSTVTAYQQQSKMSPFQPPAQPSDVSSVSYTPQAIKNSQLRTLGDNPSTLTYGLCFEGASHKANQGIKLGSFVSNGHYKAQRPEKTNEELQEAGLVAEANPQIQHLPLQEDSKGLSQESPFLLGDWIPATVDGRGGSYRKQAEVLPSSLEAGQNTILDGDDSLLQTVPSPPLFSPSSSNNLPQGQQPDFNLLAWTDHFLHSNPLGFQMTDCLTQGRQGLKSEPQSFDVAQNTLESNQINRPFPSLFRDLELKLQWDCRPEENAATF